MSANSSIFFSGTLRASIHSFIFVMMLFTKSNLLMFSSLFLGHLPMAATFAGPVTSRDDVPAATNQ